MGGSTFRDLIKGIEGILESGATVILMEAGKHAGEEFAKTLLSKGMKKEELPAALETFFTQSGWGKIHTDVDFAKQKVVIRIKNSATARQTKAKEPVCHFIRGYIAGTLHAIFHINTDCIETQCLAKGDPFCEFQVRNDLAKLV